MAALWVRDSHRRLPGVRPKIRIHMSNVGVSIFSGLLNAQNTKPSRGRPASARDISDAVTAAGFTVARQQIQLQAPIKTTGVHTVRVTLHPELSVNVGVNVARSESEAEIQAAGGQVGAEAFFEEGATPLSEEIDDEAESAQDA